MSNRISYALAVLLLLVAAALRLTALSELPPGLAADEINDIRIVETARQGRIEVFYDLGGQGREGLYHILLASVTTTTGTGLIGYRLLSVFAGLLSLGLLYALANRMFGHLAALAALALLTVGMSPILLARAIGPETLLPLLVTAAMLALARSLPIYGERPVREPNTIPFAALGLVLGLSFYIHPDAYLLTLFSMIFIAYMLLSGQPLSRRTLSFTWFAVVVLIVIVTPYLISSLQLPTLSGARRLLGAGGAVDLQNLLTALGGLFLVGDANPTRNLPGRPLFDLVSGLLIIVGVIAALRCWSQPRCALLILAALLLCPPALLAQENPNFRTFAPLLPIAALCFGLGVSTLYRGLPAAARPFGNAALLALLIFNIVWTVRDLFVIWPAQPAVQTAYNQRLAQLAAYLDQTVITTPTVVCTPIPRLTEAPRQLTRAQIMLLMMHRQNPPLRFVDCGSGFVFTQGGETEQVILPDENSLASAHPYVRGWMERGTVITRSGLPNETVIQLAVDEDLAAAVGAFTTTAPVIFPPEVGGSARIALPPLRFGSSLTFLGYVSDWASAYRPGDVLPVTTYWRVDGSVPSDLSLFTHVLSDPAAIAAQNDALSVQPSLLQPRDVFVQITFVQLPFTLPEGDYIISIGAYEANTDTRLNVYQDDQQRGARLFLGTLRIQRTGS